MGMWVNSNPIAWRIYHNLLDTSEDLEGNLERLSSGLRINRAADDIAGYAVSEEMTKIINGLKQAEENAQDAINFIHVAEGNEGGGGMAAIDQNLQRLCVLAVQASTETYSSADRMKIQMEVDQLVAEIDRIASATQFNTIRMLKGGQYDIHIGAGEDETIRITVTSVDVNALGIRGLSVTGATNTNAENAIGSLDVAISIKIRERTELGAYEARLNSIIDSLRGMQENQGAARSRIMDVDFAYEAMDMTRNQILMQSGLAMLAQANVIPQNVLGLI